MISGLLKAVFGGVAAVSGIGNSSNIITVVALIWITGLSVYLVTVLRQVSKSNNKNIDAIDKIYTKLNKVENKLSGFNEAIETLQKFKDDVSEKFIDKALD